MRLFLWVAAALVAVADTTNMFGTTAAYKRLPAGIPDGTIVTIFVKHKGNDAKKEREPVTINFYNLPFVDTDEDYDIPAHFRVWRDRLQPVASNSYVNGAWLPKEGRAEQPPGELDASNGWWRLDVIKCNTYQMNVFFQGYWSGVRTFRQSLDNLQSIYIISDFVDMHTAQIDIKLPNDLLPSLSVERFKDFINTERGDFGVDRKLLSFTHFPVEAYIEMTTILRASAGSRGRAPSLMFKYLTANSTYFTFMRITQLWEGDTEGLYISNEDFSAPSHLHTKITNEKPHGDLQHIILGRTGAGKVEVLVFYKSNSKLGVVVEHTIKSDYFNRPFEIMSHDGAIIAHVEHTIPSIVAFKTKS